MNVLDLLWGSIVILAALGAAVVLVRILRLDLSLLREEEASWDTGIIETADTTQAISGDVFDPGETQVIFIEPLILDTRAVEAPQYVMDELGEWNPDDHVLAEPMVLGHVLTARAWGTLDARELGMAVVAA